MKDIKPGTLSKIFTITNLRYAASRIWTCPEHKFKIWIKLCNSVNQYTTYAPVTWFSDVWLSEAFVMKHLYAPSCWLTFSWHPSSHYTLCLTSCCRYPCSCFGRPGFCFLQKFNVIYISVSLGYAVGLKTFITEFAKANL